VDLTLNKLWISLAGDNIDAAIEVGADLGADLTVSQGLSVDLN
jgi:hypothetical protein